MVLAAGTGSRMHSNTAKQYLELGGKPLLWYSLQAFERNEIIDDIILVVGKGEVNYCTNEIVEKYNFGKVDIVVEGGAERYLSVWHALQVIGEQDMTIPNRDGYVFIHDGARPFVTEDIIKNTFDAVESYHACAAGMPVKDTIRVVDQEGMSRDTPPRNLVWTVQTPQVFDTELITKAYGLLMERLDEIQKAGVQITDDAMVVEFLLHQPVKLVPASYQNIKITTPEDLMIAKSFLQV